MGPGLLAERMGMSKQEAQTVISDFYKGFPGVDKFTKDSQEMLKKIGYVTDAFGRRRHLPDATLPKFDIKSSRGSHSFNPLLESVDHIDVGTEKLINKYLNDLNNANGWKERDTIIGRAKVDALTITDNGEKISRSLRQCLNARIQGTAATMTKLAMIMVHNDEELNRLGFRLLVTVHDEVFGECPTENSEQVAKRLSEVMIEAAKVKCPDVPWKVDCYVLKHWYADELSAEVLKTYNACKDLEKVKKQYSMINPNFVEQMCEEKFNINLYEEV